VLKKWDGCEQAFDEAKGLLGLLGGCGYQEDAFVFVFV
jgi:hypothetical protein